MCTSTTNCTTRLAGGAVFGHLGRLNLIGMSIMQVNDLVDGLIVNELRARPASKGQYAMPTP